MNNLHVEVVALSVAYDSRDDHSTRGIYPNKGIARVDFVDVSKYYFRLTSFQGGKKYSPFLHGAYLVKIEVLTKTLILYKI